MTPRLTAKQTALLQWLKKRGSDVRGRWVPGLPKTASVRTLDSLLKRGAVEKRSVPLPRSQWPKKERSPLTVSYGRLEFRVSHHWLKSHVPS